MLDSEPWPVKKTQEGKMEVAGVRMVLDIMVVVVMAVAVVVRLRSISKYMPCHQSISVWVREN
ncbi:hypothetical protein E2C01_042928 [Portunus trituberculatus]|uniref:Uncharacterized protein n=1 Tax=Portunus trituberculatus TaxID=210409 RepID=A0A5B7FXU7_PORTR|nr:hypothetical protein [Portunus trituberculatus]